MNRGNPAACVVVLALLSAGAARSAHALGTAFTYQGQLQQSGSAAIGPCDLQFMLFDAAGGGAPPTGGNQIGNTAAADNVQVSNGLFTLPLDFGAAAFNMGSDRWLQIAVRCPAGSGSYQTLAPRQPLTPAPFAVFANTVADGSVSSTKLAPGAVTTSQLATNAVTSAQVADGTITMNDLANGAVSTTKIGDGQVTAAKLVAPLRLSSAIAQSSFGVLDGVSTGLNSVGVSGMANNGSNAFGVIGVANAGFGVFGSSTTGTGVLGQRSGNAAARGVGNTGAAVVGESDSGEGVRGTSQNGIGVLGQGEADPGVKGTSDEDGVYGLSTGNSDAGVHGAADAAGAAGVLGDSTAGSGVVGQSDNGVGVKGLSGGDDGVYGESTVSKGYGVHGVANTGDARGVFGESTDGSGVYGSSTNGIAVIGIGGVIGLTGFPTKSDGIGVQGVTNFGQGDSADAIGVRGIATSGTGVRGLSTTGTGVYGKSEAASSFTLAGAVGECTGNNGIGVRGVANAGTNAWGTFGESAHGVGVVAQSQDGGLFLGRAADGASKFRVTSAGTVFADGSYNCGLNIAPCFNTGIGADLAERVDTTEALHPGDLVEIDPVHADHYRLTATAQSTLVAGVVSTTPGMTMNNNDLTDNDGGVRTDTRPLLALVGKVPVKATTEGGAIRPGDLLVASSTPGHAMKAVPNPAVGSIVGKALEPLAVGNGVIKMLVMLR